MNGYQERSLKQQLKLSRHLHLYRVGGGSGGIYGFTSLEGIRQKGSLVFWISTEYSFDQPVPIPIQVGNAERGADKIRYNDKIYKIDEVQYWNGFCQCLGILEDPQS